MTSDICSSSPDEDDLLEEKPVFEENPILEHIVACKTYKLHRKLMGFFGKVQHFSPKLRDEREGEDLSQGHYRWHPLFNRLSPNIPIQKY